MNAKVALRMVNAGYALLGPDPRIEIGTFGRLQLKWDKPDVARIFEAMDTARLADADGYSNAELIATQLDEALQARGLTSLDEMLDVLDRVCPNLAPRGEGACVECGAASELQHAATCSFAPSPTPGHPKRRRKPN